MKFQEMNPSGIITQKIHTLGYQALWLAYFSNCPNDGVTGKDRDEARINLLRLRGPDPDLIWDYNSSLASDEFPWSVKTPYWPELLGLGGSPHEAYQDWQEKFANTWHRKRLENLFTLICGLATKDVDFNFQVSELRMQAQSNLAEINAFIKDWKDGKLGISKGADR